MIAGRAALRRVRWLAMTLVLAASAAAAQTYPERPLRLVRIHQTESGEIVLYRTTRDLETEDLESLEA